MAVIKISDLPALPSGAASGDLVAVVKGASTYKGTVAQLLTGYLGAITSKVAFSGEDATLSLPNHDDAAQSALTPAVGMVLWNTDNERIEVWNGSAWAPVGGGVGSDSITNESDVTGATVSDALDALDSAKADASAVASALEDYLPLAGGTMSGPVNMGGQALHNASYVGAQGGLAGSLPTLGAFRMPYGGALYALAFNGSDNRRVLFYGDGASNNNVLTVGDTGMRVTIEGVSAAVDAVLVRTGGTTRFAFGNQEVQSAVNFKFARSFDPVIQQLTLGTGTPNKLTLAGQDNNDGAGGDAILRTGIGTTAFGKARVQVGTDDVITAGAATLASEALVEDGDVLAYDSATGEAVWMPPADILRGPYPLYDSSGNLRWTLDVDESGHLALVRRDINGDPEATVLSIDLGTGHTVIGEGLSVANDGLLEDVAPAADAANETVADSGTLVRQRSMASDSITRYRATLIAKSGSDFYLKVVEAWFWNNAGTATLIDQRTVHEVTDLAGTFVADATGSAARFTYTNSSGGSVVASMRIAEAREPYPS